MKFQPREQILTFEEIERFVRVAVTLGVRKLRITGGEPLVRKDLREADRASWRRSKALRIWR